MLTEACLQEAARRRRDRRESVRWKTDRIIRIRVHHGRRARTGRIVERSFTGLVVRMENKDTPRAGARFHPMDDHTALRNGFREARVLRTAGVKDEPGMSMVYAEILA